MRNTQTVKAWYDQLTANGLYSVFAPQYKGGAKSQYIATVFNEATLPYFRTAKYSKVLDLGCGTGVLSNQLPFFTVLTVGADISPALLEFAKKQTSTDNRKASYIQIDGEKLPFKNKQFDSVIARESLNHVSDEQLPTVISQINDILCKGGHFYFIDQISESLYWRTQAEFTTRRSVDEIKSIAKSGGLECISSYVVRKPRFFWIYLFWFKLLPKVLMRPLARLEIKFNKRFFNIKTNRWHDVLFVFKKIS